jgi:SnoaL-like domain
MAKSRWERYAASWSMPEASRLKRLAEVASPNVTYMDPNIAVAGIAAFSQYMTGFQTKVPGAGFVILEAFEHHQRTISRWNMVGADKAILGTGMSFAELAEDGKFVAITGFYSTP